MHNQPIHIGTRDSFGAETPVFLRPEDRRAHTYIVGKTGTGKSSLLKNIIEQDLAAGRGVALIDPHGDLAESLLDAIPRHRIGDVTYFNAGDTEFPVAWNILSIAAGDNPALIASGVVAAFKAIWRDSWGPRLEYLLYAAVASLLECQNVSLLGVSRILSDRNYRRSIVKRVTDPGLKLFWQNEFERYDERFLREAIAPVQNKVGQLLLAPHVRHIFGQVTSRINIRFIMDNRRIFIVNLAKGRIGEDKANLLGALLVSAFQTAAMGRASVPESKREDFHLVIDEFQNFTTDSFTSILSEARKYRLNLTIAHQYIDQMPEEVRAAVFGNIGTMITLRVGEHDAALLAREYGASVVPEHFTDLPNYQALVRPVAINTQDEPYRANLQGPRDPQGNRRATIERRSRERFATPVETVKRRLQRWLGTSFHG